MASDELLRIEGRQALEKNKHKKKMKKITSVESRRALFAPTPTLCGQRDAALLTPIHWHPWPPNLTELSKIESGIASIWPCQRQCIVILALKRKKIGEPCSTVPCLPHFQLDAL